MTFETVTAPGYLETLVERLNDDTPLTWLAQAREILEADVKMHTTILDVGCATGYAVKVFPELEYLGIDVEEKYLEIARARFSENHRVKFLSHDMTRTPIEDRKDIVIVGAMLEHCPTLAPALDNVLASTGRTVLIRTSLGHSQEIHTIPSPKPAFADMVRKFHNQYSFIDIFRALERHGFAGRLIRDRYTDSIPRYVDEAIRTFYFVRATRV